MAISEANFSISVLTIQTKTTGQNVISSSISSGTGLFPAMTQNVTNGTGANKATLRYTSKITVGTGSSNNFDLTTLTDEYGVIFGFILVKWFLLRIRSPITGKRLVIGNAVTNPWLGWFGAVGNTEEARSILLKESQIDGWSVGPTDKQLLVNNPSTVDVTYDLLILGE